MQIASFLQAGCSVKVLLADVCCFFLWLPQFANHWKRSTASSTTVSYSSKTDSVLCMVKSVVDRFVVKAPIELVKFRAEYYRHCITSLLKAVGVNIERSVVSTRQLVQHD